MEIQELRETIRENLPDYIKGQKDEIQEHYIEYELLKRYWETFPERYFHFTNRQGVECSVDTNTVNVRLSVKKQGGTDEQAEAAVQHRNTYALPIIRRMSAHKGKIKGLFGTKYSPAIVEHADEIIDLFAQFYTVNDIINVLKVKKGYSVSPTLLKVFYQDNRETIERRKLKFIDSKKDFFIATETGRLQVLNELLLTWRMKFSQEEKISYSTEIRKVLEQARKECKGEQLFLTVDGKIDINAMIHGQDNVAEALQKLPINMMVIGLVAAKAGINPATIIGQLASSYYKDHNGYNTNFLDGKDIQLPGDIIRNISWDELAGRVMTQSNEISPIEDAIVVEEREVSKVEEGRSKLLELLKKGPSKEEIDADKKEITSVNDITKRVYRQRKVERGPEDEKTAKMREYRRQRYHKMKGKKKDGEESDDK